MRSDESLVEYACEDRIAVLTLNRPNKLNAVSDDLIEALADALKRFDLDSNALVGILCGKGRAFCSGADVQQRQLRSRERLANEGGPGAGGTAQIDLFRSGVNSKPIIAAPHGYAVGLGLSLVLRCDMVVAEAGTRFQVTEVTRGLSGARYWALMKMRGVAAFAEDVCLTGRYFTAEEALAAGLIGHVASKGEHMAAAFKLARTIAANPPLSVREIVRARRYRADRLEREILYGGEMLKLYLTEDFQEAVQAFSEKRPPRPFKGR
jgi:enoyl-CoA hydratase/carnithine racemase